MRKRICARITPGEGTTSAALLRVVDVATLATQVSRGSTRYFDALISESVASSEAYLQRIAATFAKSSVVCNTENGKPEDVILEKAGENTTLITMAAHGRSGITAS